MSATTLTRPSINQSQGGAISAEACITSHPFGRIAGIEKAAEMSLDTMYRSLTGGDQFTQEVRSYLLQLPSEDRLIAEAVYSRHAVEPKS
jgi:hypothetical protein